MLSRKDYKAITEIIALCRCPDYYGDVEAGINQGCQDIAHRLADYFQQGNPRFDRQGFLDACFAD